MVNPTQEQLKQTIVKHREENDKLSRQIVQSPERMKAEQERMKRQLTSLHQNKEIRVKYLVDLREQEPRRQHVDRDAEHLLRLLTDINSDKEKERCDLMFL